ncbi:MAG TPA: hypothetical protein VKT49_04570 [Bryobacteraceae bacterium]|nr:hypothetical protein [Bryobacteraceae bacterium]
MSPTGSPWKPLVAGLSCALLVLLWQFLTVRYNYNGEWSGLFYTGERQKLAPVVEAEHPFLLPDSYGWDGQFYHAIAHDPLLLRDTAPYIDSARLRYRRILIPALAALLAAGNDTLVDGAYHGLIILFIALGAWWLARIAQKAGSPAILGTAFIFLPASIVSIDRQAVDVGLLCFCCGFALYTRYPGNPRALYAVLVLAALVRDTGFLLAAAYCVWLLLRRDFRKCAVFATTGLPGVAWYVFVNSRTDPYSFDASPLALPFSGVFDRLTHPMTYFGGSFKVGLIQGTDFLAAAGALLALLLAFRFVRRRRPDPVDLAIVLFALLGIVVWHRGDWLEALDYARILSPLLLFEALVCLEGAGWLNLAPLCMTLPRFGIEMGAQLAGIARGLL